MPGAKAEAFNSFHFMSFHFASFRFINFIWLIERIYVRIYIYLPIYLASDSLAQLRLGSGAT